LYFSGEGQANFGDVIYAVKSHKPNLALRLEATARRDASGVCYYASSANPLDTEELSNEEIESLIRTLGRTGFCDCVVADANLSVGDRILTLFGLASKIVIVYDGTDVSNVKLYRAYEALRILEDSKGLEVLHKTALFCNKFSNKTGKQTEITALRKLGGVPKFEHLATDRIVQKLVAENAVAPIVAYLTGGGPQ
jgi:MinD-like ATPase involved in chromosome partitioning or flagellar assembly